MSIPKDLEQTCTETPETRMITGAVFDEDGVIPLGVFPCTGGVYNGAVCAILSRAQIEELITHLQTALTLPDQEYK